MSPDGTIAVKQVEYVLERYRGFYKHTWAKEMLARVGNTKLENAFHNLCLGLKQASNTHQIPYLMTESLAGFSRGYVRTFEPHSEKMFGEICDRLIAKMGTGLTRTKQKDVRKYLGEIGGEIRQLNERDGIEPQVWWKMALGQQEFQLAIFGSQNLCYCAQVFSYECFLTDCYVLLGGDEKHQTNQERFWSGLSAQMSRDCKYDYWDDQPIYIAREVRNCFAHRGGKAKPKLREALNSVSHPDNRVYVSEEGDITIMATDNWLLFALIETKVSQLIDEVMPRL